MTSDSQYSILNGDEHSYIGKLEELKRRITGDYLNAVKVAVSEVCNDPDLSIADRAQIIEEIIGISGGALSDLVRTIPEEAPEIYRDRADKSENAYGFIRRVYSKFLPLGFHRGHLKKLDSGLYWSLHDLSKHVPIPEDVYIPTVSERNDAKVDQLNRGGVFVGDAGELIRLTAAARKRASKGDAQLD